jgi:uncharacterized membrane protein
MKKQEFLSLLKKKLSSLPKGEIEERISFYGEMIDDRIEDGMSEAEAVRDVGGPALLSDTAPRGKERKERVEKKQERKNSRLLVILLLAFGFPIWLPLLISAVAVAVSLYAALWSLLISLWAVFISLAVSAPAGLIIGLINIFSGNGAVGALIIGSGFAAGGLAIFAYFGCIAATRATYRLTSIIVTSAKKFFFEFGVRK